MRFAPILLALAAGLAVAGCQFKPTPDPTLSKRDAEWMKLVPAAQEDPIFARYEIVDPTGEAPGTIVVDPGQRYLYLVMADGRAMRYGIGVGRQGFSWNGTATIQRKHKWPSWYPPAEMQARDERARRWAKGMPGGPTNPLGARALYLYQGGRDTLYRIHGTNEPQSIGRAVSSGCIRMLNADVIDLYERVPKGTRVVVLPSSSPMARLGGAARRLPQAVSNLVNPG